MKALVLLPVQIITLLYMLYGQLCVLKDSLDFIKVYQQTV